jgi:hypothetical protein
VELSFQNTNQTGALPHWLGNLLIKACCAWLGALMGRFPYIIQNLMDWNYSFCIEIVWQDRCQINYRIWAILVRIVNRNIALSFRNLSYVWPLYFVYGRIVCNGQEFSANV